MVCIIIDTHCAAIAKDNHVCKYTPKPILISYDWIAHDADI